MKVKISNTLNRYHKLILPMGAWLLLLTFFILLMNLIIQWEVEKQLWQRALDEGFYMTRLLRSSTLNYLVNQRGKSLEEMSDRKRAVLKIFEYFMAQKEVMFGSIEDEKGEVWCECVTTELRGIPETKIDLFWDDGKTDFGSIRSRAAQVKKAPYYNLILPLVQNGQVIGRISLGFARSNTNNRIREVTQAIRKKLSLYSALGLLIFTMLTVYVIRLLQRVHRLQNNVLEREHFAKVGRMANGLAHELKNPLSAMSMSIQMIDEDLSNEQFDREQFSEMMGDIKSEAKRLNDVLEGFLRFARPSPLKLEATDLTEMVNSIVRLMRPQLVMKNLELIVVAAPNLPKLLLDGEKLKQVLINLVLNAMDASASGNKIEIGLEYTKKEVIITFTDYGQGIQPENLPFVFDTYFTTKKGGSGLGLAISKKIVEEHDGMIFCTSTPSVKTTFTITLPAKRSL